MRSLEGQWRLSEALETYLAHLGHTYDRNNMYKLVCVVDNIDKHMGSDYAAPATVDELQSCEAVVLFADRVWLHLTRTSPELASALSPFERV